MICKGNPVSPGIAVGKVLLYETGCAPVSEAHILANEADAALKRYDASLEQAKQELLHLQESHHPKGHLRVLWS